MKTSMRRMWLMKNLNLLASFILPAPRFGSLGHDPQHELIKERNGEGCFPVSGAIDHPLFYKPIANRAELVHFNLQYVCHVARAMVARPQISQSSKILSPSRG